jgi:AcrR family transcriptional regulator
VAAAVPLFLDGGPAVTTREVAQAAGIAEGTVFRAFADKDELVEAVIEAALDPTPLDEALDAIDPDLPLVDRLVAAVDALRERVTTFLKVIPLVGSVADGRLKTGGAPVHLPRLEALLAPDSARLRLSPTETAHLLRGMVVASVHPSFHPGQPRSSTEIVDLLLHGVAREA